MCLKNKQVMKLNMLPAAVKCLSDGLVAASPCFMA